MYILQDSTASSSVVCVSWIFQYWEETFKSSDRECCVLYYITDHCCNSICVSNCCGETICIVSLCNISLLLFLLFLLLLVLLLFLLLFLLFLILFFLFLLLLLFLHLLLFLFLLLLFLLFLFFLILLRPSLSFYSSLFREQLPYIIATASNTWGLFILAFLLGYGLVEVPRGIFQASLHTYTLNHCYFRAAKLYIDMAEANEDLQEVTQV